MGSEYVACMEDVLTLYTSEYDPNYPVVCIDEKLCVLLEDSLMPIEPKPGKSKKQDFQYNKNGTCNLFMITEPLVGWRDVKVTDTRKKDDFVECLKDLVDKYYPQAKTIRLVCDNLNTHKLHHLYEFYPPEEAKRIIDKIEIHHTPKHGSWLNMAEIEIHAISKQCINQRIGYKEDVEECVKLWVKDRNSGDYVIDWRFTTEDARIKLRHLYPKIQRKSAKI